MTDHPARKLFKSGLTYNEISKRLNITWSQARYQSDPDGDWRRELVAKRCFICKRVKEPEEFALDNTKPDRLSYKCRACVTEYTAKQTQRRRARREAQRVADKHPDRLYTCPACGMKRGEDGIWFTTAEAAAECCRGAVAPHLRGNCRPTRGKYQPRHRFVAAGEYA